jgi:predicted MFS family arabinose efflux permease
MVALDAAMVGWELRARQPMLPLGLFRSSGFSAGNLAIFCWSASVLGALFLMAQFLQTALGDRPLAAGLQLMPWGATTFIVPQLAGRLIARLGERRFIAGGLALQAASMAWIALMARPDLPYWQLIAPLMLSGAGLAIAIPAIQSTIIGSVAPQHLGKASGTLNTIRQLGGVFGIAVIAAVFTTAGSYASPQTFSHGFTAAIAASGALALVGAFAGTAPPGRRHAPTTAPALPGNRHGGAPVARSGP